MVKSKPQYIESEHQKALYKWWWMQYPAYKNLFIHVRNEGRRSKLEGARAKAMGMQKGICDIFLSIIRGRYGGFYIELKRPGERPTEEQFIMQDLLRGQGYKVEWYDNWTDASYAIRAYMESGKCSCDCKCGYG